MPHYPDFDEFTELAKRSDFITVYRQLANDTLTPVGVFYALYDGSSTFLLESVAGGEEIARYSFLAVNPSLHFEARDKNTRLRTLTTRLTGPESPDWSGDGQYMGPGDPIDALQSLLSSYNSDRVPGLPRFCGGAVGYVSYDAVRYTEHLPRPPKDDKDDRNLPDLAFDFYESVVIFDHLNKTIIVTAHARVSTAHGSGSNGDLRAAYDKACRRIDTLVRRIQKPTPVPLPDSDISHPVHRGFDKSTFERPQFEAAVRACKEYIRAGDIFQVVISQRLQTETAASPFDVYRALRVLNPSPFMFYFRSSQILSGRRPICLVGSSPELFLRVEDGQITIRPLAGTRPRGRTEQEDDDLARQLLEDEKERAEHIMLVDLGRNDVGRVAAYNTVQLTDLMIVERYSHVMHISSNVTGRLAPEKTAFDALRACLPAGTVSGAPKVRAMQIIDKLEPVRRGPYAGAVGFFDFKGNMETCLALRTLVFNGQRAFLQAGAGIVYDSVPEFEYTETLNKAKALLKAIEIAEGWRFSMAADSVSVLSCIQPTAEMHIGNYFGAVANWVRLQEEHKCVYGIVDLHAMTMPYEPFELRENAERMVIELLACGIDPENTILFIQSLVPEHSELCWILGCFCSFGDLSRMTQFKEKAEQAGDFVSAGLFTYPVLQAADILIYRAKFVPVGKDQEQHLELSRAIARRFNKQFKVDYFPEPQPLFTDTPKIMSLAVPEQKMSKSLPRHYIGLFEEEQSIREKIKVAVTDSGEPPSGAQMSPGVENLFEILQACDKSEKKDRATELLREYERGVRKYSVLKQVVADALVELTARLRARRAEIPADFARQKVRQMSEKAREIAAKRLKDVRDLVGLPERS